MAFGVVGDSECPCIQRQIVCESNRGDVGRTDAFKERGVELLHLFRRVTVVFQVYLGSDSILRAEAQSDVVRVKQAAAAYDAEISRTRQIAIWPAMKHTRKPGALLPPAWDSSFSAEARFTRVPRQAGANPNRIPVNNETNPQNTKTRMSKLTIGRMGKVGGVIRRSTGRSQYVSKRPRLPLNDASRTLSVNTWRINLPRDARARTAISGGGPSRGRA
jgi:hypothetical protein